MCFFDLFSDFSYRVSKPTHKLGAWSKLRTSSKSYFPHWRDIFQINCYRCHRWLREGHRKCSPIGYGRWGMREHPTSLLGKNSNFLFSPAIFASYPQEFLRWQSGLADQVIHCHQNFWLNLQTHLFADICDGIFLKTDSTLKFINSVLDATHVGYSGVDGRSEYRSSQRNGPDFGLTSFKE